MLRKILNKDIICEEYLYNLGNGISIFTKILSIAGRTGKTALFLHGGGVTGNHTLSIRPSMHLIEKGVFNRIILPDRRGTGASSPFTSDIRLIEQAQDMKKLLDKIGISGDLSVIGVSYGGPVALLLASIDPRIESVTLMASSDELNLTKGKLNIFYKTGIMQGFIKLFIYSFLGRSRVSNKLKYVDMDFVYEIHTAAGLVKAQVDILSKISREKMKSLFLMVDSVFNKDNMSIPENLSLNIPVLQIIGNKDKVWKVKKTEEYKKQFPQFRQIIIPGVKHKGIFLQGEIFINAL
ncbi:MAG: alpha/beta fold hydrolase [Bacillota bacterium]